MIVGNDLGTTNSLAAVWQDGESRVIPNAFGDNLTPSVVGMGRTSKLKVHPRDDVENQSALHRGELLYQESLGPLREMIGERMGHFRVVLERQAPRELKRARQEFLAFLDGRDLDVW